MGVWCLCNTSLVDPREVFVYTAIWQILAKCVSMTTIRTEAQAYVSKKYDFKINNVARVERDIENRQEATSAGSWKELPVRRKMTVDYLQDEEYQVHNANKRQKALSSDMNCIENFNAEDVARFTSTLVNGFADVIRRCSAADRLVLRL